MAEDTGQKTGQAPLLGFSWGDRFAALVAEAGMLTAVAWKLAERGVGSDDVASMERALRRMRTRGQRDGGSWGQRILRIFGVPRGVEERLRFMGRYRGPFNDLPLPAGATLLRAQVIAERLEDQELLSRVERVNRQTSRPAST